MASSSTPSSAPIEKTPWQRALAAKDADGTYSLEAALTLFATAFGPLPGVDAELDLSENGLVERTTAVRALLAYEADLTPEQAAAVEAYIAPPADADLVVIPPVEASRNRITLAAISNDLRQRIFDTVSGWRAQISQRLHRDFIGDINVYYRQRPTTMPKTIVAGAWSRFPGGVFGDCDVTVFPGVEATSDADLSVVLAHETFHCFQFDYLRTRSAIFGRPDWVMEGQASWVGEELNRGGGSQLGNFAWNRYLTERVSLVERLNDAIGFYAHLDERGTDPWTKFLPQLDAAGDNAASFTAAGANNDDFINTWASSLLRQPERGDGWDTTGPGITSSSYSPELLTLSDGARVDLSVPFYINQIRMLHLQSDLVHVSIEGHGRLSDGALNTADLTDVWFCVAGHDCEPKCPDGQNDIPEIRGTVGEVVAIATSGGIDGTLGTAEGMDVPDDEECETPEPTPRTALRAHIERPAMPDYAFMAGTVFDVTTCEGPYGHWAGYMGAGGLATQGQVLVPWQQLPIDFTFAGAPGSQTSAPGSQTTNVTAAGQVTYALPVPQQIDVSYPLVVTVDEDTMTVVGLAGFVTGQSPDTPIEVALEPAPPGTCLDL